MVIIPNETLAVYQALSFGMEKKQSIMEKTILG